MSTTEHALYRFYSATGQLLYVGISNNPEPRRLIWICAVCSKPIDDHGGYLHVDMTAVARLRRRRVAGVRARGLRRRPDHRQPDRGAARPAARAHPVLSTPLPRKDTAS